MYPRETQLHARQEYATPDSVCTSYSQIMAQASYKAKELYVNY